MEQDLIARATVKIHAPTEAVWRALVTPRDIKQYMFGADVVSDWREGRTITWRGEWLGKPYEDHGVILQVRPRQLLRYSHYSPRSGLPDLPRFHHTVSIELTPEPDGTLVVLTQDNNSSDEGRQHAEKNWGAMLASLKKYLETMAAPVREPVRVPEPHPSHP